MLFNASDRLSYSDIKTQLNLADEDVVRLLQSLSCAKYKILTKEPSSKTVSETDHFQFNSKFTDRMRRIRVCFLTISCLFYIILLCFVFFCIYCVTCFIYQSDSFAACGREEESCGGC